VCRIGIRNRAARRIIDALFEVWLGRTHAKYPINAQRDLLAELVEIIY
jgi:hypothetical protein